MSVQVKALRGYPTKKSIRELLEHHGAFYRALDRYSVDHRVFWVGVKTNTSMQLVAKDLIAQGYPCAVRLYGVEPGLTGCLTIEEKAQ